MKKQNFNLLYEAIIIVSTVIHCCIYNTAYIISIFFMKLLSLSVYDNYLDRYIVFAISIFFMKLLSLSERIIIYIFLLRLYISIFFMKLLSLSVWSRFLGLIGKNYFNLLYEAIIIVRPPFLLCIYGTCPRFQSSLWSYYHCQDIIDLIFSDFFYF